MLISIIIPCYNVQDYIEECVRSAFSQIYQHIEVICIDNNSSDATWEKLIQLKQQYSKLIIVKETKTGAPAARNKGLTLSKGKWIQFLDADDLLYPNKILHQVTLINPDTPFIVGTSIFRKIDGSESVVLPLTDNVYKALYLTRLGNTCCNLWNKRLLLKANGWNESLKSSQEADLMFRLLKSSENVIIDTEPLTIVRERESGQISQSNPAKKWTRYVQLRLEIIEWLKTERMDYFKSNSNYFHSILLTNIRNIAPHNLSLAVSLREKHIPRYFLPTTINGHISVYSFLYFLLGFKCTEKLYKTVRKVLCLNH
ncbi:glycosyltransferase family 2 protein [Marinilabiliaceae bacterium JC017]|nr:glycosyltransferase family 2 protein [Marinilabiliaceae bacterium JC017]